jgi:hypothetical protein
VRLEGRVDRIPHLRRCIVGAVIAVVLAAASGAAARTTSTVLLRIHTDGVVVGSPGDFRCVGRCSIPFARGTLVSLHALHRRHFDFGRWEEGCVGTSRTCTVALDRSQSVRVSYEGVAQDVALTVGGPGTVRSRPEGIVCGGGHDSCTADFPWGTKVRLVPTSGSGRFSRWGAACWNVGHNPCGLSIRHDTEVIAAFGHRRGARTPQVLTVRSFEQSVRSKSSPTGIACPGICRASFPAGTHVLLTLSDGEWDGGDCVGDVTTRCPLVLDAPATVMVRRQAPHSVVAPETTHVGVNVTVSGAGTVTAPGIKCGGATGTLFDCENSFKPRQVVVLDAKPGKRAQFAGWKQFCTGTKPRCTLFIIAPVTVGAVFRR